MPTDDTTRRRRSRPPPRLLQVIGKTEVSPGLLRVTLGGQALNGFGAEMKGPDADGSDLEAPVAAGTAANWAGASVKLLLPQAGQSADDLHRQMLQTQSTPDLARASASDQLQRPLKRTYTIRHHRPQQNQLDLDFVLHEAAGPATLWAINATAGQSILVTGPGRLRLLNTKADWFLLAGDLSALPVISCQLERLPPTAVGKVFVAIEHKLDIQRLAKPDGMELVWLVPDRNSITPGQPVTGAVAEALTEPGKLLLDACRNMRWRTGTPSVFMAGEASCIRSLRHWLANDRNLPAEQRYTAGYWASGHDEDSFQPIKMAHQLV